MFGTAAAIDFALTAAFIKQMTDEISPTGWGILRPLVALRGGRSPGVIGPVPGPERLPRRAR